MIGVLLFFFSITLLFLVSDKLNLLTVQLIGLNWLGVTLVVDFAYRRIHGQSYFPLNKERLKELGRISLLAILFCLLLEFFGVYTTRLWYYPYFPLLYYVLMAPLAFSVYTLILFALYEIIKTYLEKTYGLRRTSLGSLLKKVYPGLMQVEFIVGSAGTIFSTIYSLSFASKFTATVLDLTKPFGAEVAWWLPFLALISIFFIFEYLSFKQNKETLTLDVIRGDFIPFLAIVGATILAIMLIEFVNSPFQIWVFSNWGLSNLRVMNIPILAYCAWPVQFLTFLSMFRFFLTKREVKIW